MRQSKINTVLIDSFAIIDVRHSRSSGTVYAGLQLIFSGQWPFDVLADAVTELEQVLRARFTARRLGDVEIRQEPLRARDALLLIRLRRPGGTTAEAVESALRETLGEFPVLVAPRRSRRLAI